MLAQVILIVRAPFKGQGAVGAQKCPYSSVDTLMDLWIDRNSDDDRTIIFSVLINKITRVDLSPAAERNV